jgi:hypothetical protein
MANIPITLGSGAASIAAETVGGVSYQIIEVIGAGAASTLSIDPEGAAKVSVIGRVTTVFPAGSVATMVNPAGSVTAVSATMVAGSIMSVTNPAGSVTTVLATIVAGSITTVVNPAASVTGVRTDSASVITVPQISSIITIWTNPSIVGTYAEDAGHTTADKGFFVMGVRNDAMPSITSADLDYSPFAVGPTGAITAHNAPITKWVQGTADLRVSLGGSIIAIAKQGASVFTYITAVQVANMGSASVLVTLTGGLGSILGYTIAPAGGGSNILYPNALKTGENSDFAASISGTASVLVSAQGFTAKI